MSQLRRPHDHHRRRLRAPMARSAGGQNRRMILSTVRAHSLNRDRHGKPTSHVNWQLLRKELIRSKRSCATRLSRSKEVVAVRKKAFHVVMTAAPAVVFLGSINL